MDARQDSYKRGSLSHWEDDWARKRATYSFTSPVDDWGYFDLFRGRYLEKLILKNKNISSLECGCGSASISVYFANGGVKATMLDASLGALKVARDNFDNYHLGGDFINGNMESLPFADAKFDVVMSFGVLEHFEDMTPVTQEMVRVLKPGGIFFASVSPKKYSVQILGNLFNTLMRFLYNLKHLRFKEAFLHSYPPPPGFYENSYSAREYVRVMQGCGLKDVKLSGSRPFPSLELPWETIKAYIVLMKILRPLHLFFENHSSRLTEIWGTEWNILASKE